MSLLLDALNRASKDKAAVVASAAARAAESPSSSPLELTPNLTVSTAQPAASPTTTWPTIGLSLAPSHSEPLLQPHSPSDTIDVMASGDDGMTLAAKPQPPAPPVQRENHPAPLTVAEPVLPQKLESPPLAVSKPPPRDAPQVAQSILRAKAPSPPAGNRKRLIALGSVAALLAAGLGSVMLGWWGDPLTGFQKSSLAGTAAQSTAMATRTEPAASAAVAPQDTATLPVSSQAHATALPEMTQRAVLRPTETPKPASRIPDECATGQGSPDCKTSNQPTPAIALGKSNKTLLQSRSNGPSALEVGYAALTQGRLQEAVQAYTQALLGNAEERDALLGLAYIAHRQGREDEARTYYTRVLRQEPGNPVAKAGLITLSPSDDTQDLGSRSRDVAEQNPDSAAAQSLLGHNLVRQGRLSDAQQLFYRAHLLEPSVALHAFNLAVALDRLRNYGPAQSYYEQALALSTQAGGERASGVTHSVVQARLEQLRSAASANPAGSR